MDLRVWRSDFHLPFFDHAAIVNNRSPWSYSIPKFLWTSPILRASMRAGSNWNAVLWQVFLDSPGDLNWTNVLAPSVKITTYPWLQVLKDTEKFLRNPWSFFNFQNWSVNQITQERKERRRVNNTQCTPSRVFRRATWVKAIELFKLLWQKSARDELPKMLTGYHT